MPSLTSKKAYELQPNDFIKNDVKRLDMSSGKKSQQYPVVIFLEQGLVPQKNTQYICIAYSKRLN